MNLKRFQGNTIAEARAAARRELGSKPVVLESNEPMGDQPATVTVICDQSEPASPAAKSSATRAMKKIRNKLYRRSDFLREGLPGMQPTDDRHDSSGETSTTINGKAQANGSRHRREGVLFEKSSAPNTGEGPHSEPGAPIDHDEKVKPAEASSSYSTDENPFAHDRFRGRSTLFPSFEETMESSIPDEDEGTEGNGLKMRMEQLEERVMERIDRLEEQLIQPQRALPLQYASHHGFKNLLNAGVPEALAARWFSELLERGLDPAAHPELFMNRLGQHIRLEIDPLEDAPSSGRAPKLFMGRPGCGKSTLIEKLLNDRRHGVAALVQLKTEAKEGGYSKLRYIAEYHDQPFFQVEYGQSLNEVLPPVQTFDQLYIETSIGGGHDEKACSRLDYILKQTGHIEELEIHEVKSMAGSAEKVDNPLIGEHPLQPSILNLTQLDLDNRWGRLLPTLLQTDCAIRWTTCSAQANDLPERFRAQKFVNHLIHES